MSCAPDTAPGVAMLLATMLLPLAAQVPTTAECQAVLTELDRAWNSGRADDYLRLFAPEQPLLHELHRQRTQALLERAAHPLRQSQCAAVRQVGDEFVARVHYRMSPPPGSALAGFQEDGLLVVRHRGGTLVPVLAVDLPATAQCGDDVFECPACNYRIGGAPGWLCVPIARECTAAVEGATFLLLGTDIALEISVQLGDYQEPAEITATALARRASARVAGAHPAPTEPWQPPSLDRPIEGSTAARAVLELPDGQQLRFHVVALGRLRHLLLLRGDAAALRREAASVGALLATYRLLQTDAKVTAQATLSLAQHTGGRLDGCDYHNPRHGIRVAGPEGWRGVERCGGTLFQVLWTCPQQSGRMWVSGQAPPSGLSAWTTELADKWLADLCGRAGLQLGCAEDSGWSAAAGTAARRRSVVFPPAAAGGAVGPPAERVLELLLRDDLLVISDGYTTDAMQREPLRRAVASVSPL